MESRKLLIIIRYVDIAFLILGIAIFKKDNVDIYAVILVLLFIINNQIRFFMLYSGRTAVLASLVLECVLSYLCYKNYGGIEFFYFFTAVLDGAFLLSGRLTYLVDGLIILAMLLITRGSSAGELVSGVSALVTLAILAAYIRDERGRKLKAQELYDKLRISEDSLKKANSDLEAYASSVEELTLLRERNRISREIHDSVGHSLSTMIIQLGAIEKIAEQDGKAAAEVAANLREFAKNSLQEVRMAVRELKPREFHKYEGILAVEELVKNFTKLTGIEVRLGFTKEKWPLSADQSLVIYRVVQEFLSNSLRHGKAAKVNIFMNFGSGSIVLSLQDNGVGTDAVKKGVGLTSIWERVNELGGTVEYNTKKGQGFVMKVVLKLDEGPLF